MNTPLIKLGMTKQLGATSDQRGAVTTELGVVGAADALVWTGRDALGAYSRNIVFPPTPPSLTPDLDSLTVEGGIRLGRGGGSATIAALGNAGTTATITAVLGKEDHAEFTLTSNGTGQAVGLVIRITRTNAVANTLYDLVLIPRNANAVLANMYVGTRNVAYAEIGFGVAPVALQIYGISYVWVN